MWMHVGLALSPHFTQDSLDHLLASGDETRIRTGRGIRQPGMPPGRRGRRIRSGFRAGSVRYSCTVSPKSAVVPYFSL